MSEQDFTTATPPGELPKIDSIFDFSAEALGQLKFWLEQAGLNIPISQVIGFNMFTAQAASTVFASETTTSTTFAELGTSGPNLTGLPDGKYLIVFGFLGATSVAGSDILMGIRVNATDPSDQECAQSATPTNVTLMMAVVKDLDAQNNTVSARYRVLADTGTFARRWMIALRISNL